MNPPVLSTETIDDVKRLFSELIALSKASGYFVPPEAPKGDLTASDMEKLANVCSAVQMFGDVYDLDDARVLTELSKFTAYLAFWYLDRKSCSAAITAALLTMSDYRAKHQASPEYLPTWTGNGTVQ